MLGTKACNGHSPTPCSQRDAANCNCDGQWLMGKSHPIIPAPSCTGPSNNVTSASGGRLQGRDSPFRPTSCLSYLSGPAPGERDSRSPFPMGFRFVCWWVYRWGGNACSGIADFFVHVGTVSGTHKEKRSVTSGLRIFFADTGGASWEGMAQQSYPRPGRHFRASLPFFVCREGA